MEAVLLCGLQAAGKTAFYLERFLLTHVRISLDMLKTRKREQTLIDACLRARQPYVIDDTNATSAIRRLHVEAAHAFGFKVSVYRLMIPVDLALARNRERADRQRVPAPAILRTQASFEPPSWEEELDKLYEVWPEDSGFRVREVPRPS